MKAMLALFAFFMMSTAPVFAAEKHGHDHKPLHGGIASAQGRTATVQAVMTASQRHCAGVGATRTRWAPLREFVPEDGWGIQEARITVSDEPYHLVLLQAMGTTGTTATAAIAFAARRR